MVKESADLEADTRAIKGLHHGQRIKITAYGGTGEYTFEKHQNVPDSSGRYPDFISLTSPHGRPESLPIGLVAKAVRESVTGALTPVSPQSFEAYTQHSGELDASTYAAVMACRVTEVEYAAAARTLLELGLSDHATIDMAARIVGTLGQDERTQDPMWLIIEVTLLLGRF